MAQYFKYYQKEEKGRWEVAPDKKGLTRELRQRGAKRASVLVVSAVIDESTDSDKLSYKGPFYVDIDSSGDLQGAIDSTKEFVKKLDQLGVHESAYQIHASGKKGFHVYLHPSTFGVTRAVKNLPRIYREMAVDLYVPGLDFQVYCGGRGNLFRIPNVKREDGRYNVPIFRKELENLTPARYRELTTRPRDDVIGVFMQPQTYATGSVVQLYYSAKARFERLDKEKQKVPVAATELAQFTNDPPNCVGDLEQGKVREGLNFNQAAFQMAIFINRAGVSAVKRQSLMSRMSVTSVSTSYPTQKERENHLSGLVSYIQHQPHKSFSCAAMRSVISTNPCENCPLYDEKSHLEELYDVVERPDGYYVVSARGAERRLTNFLLLPKTVVVSRGDINKMGTKTREYTQVTIERNHEFIATTNLADDKWNSRSAFLGAFTGIGDNLRVTATDQDVQALKHYILRDVTKMEEKEVVVSVGIHRQMLNNKPRFTYVETGLSANKWGIQNTHLFLPKVNVEDAALPALVRINLVRTGDHRHERALRNLIQVNEQEVTAAFFGWYMAAHLKAHIFGLRTEFPLLGVWGGRGSGKTQTTYLFGLLHGCDFFVNPTPTMTAITEFAFLNHACSSNTVPRIFDEFNKAGMGKSRYSRFSEYLKNLFNNATSPKGTIRSNKLAVDYYKPTAPAVVLSEHQIEVSALRDRLYAIMIREPSLRPRTAHFKQAKMDKAFLMQLAKASVMTALEIREEWVDERLEHWIPQMPDSLSDRQQFGRAVILIGIDFAERVFCKDLAMDLKSEMAGLRDSFLTRVKNEQLSITGIGTTEVDALLARLGELKSLSENGQVSVQMTPSNLRSDQQFLYLDTVSIFPLLKLFSSMTGDRMPLGHAGEFKALVQAEKYYVGEVMLTDMLQTRPVMKLNLTAMREKGIDISLFL